jgi:hypothetical protein
MKKLIVMFLLGIVITSDARDKFRIEVRVYGDRTIYIPFVKKKASGILKEWVPLANYQLLTKEQALAAISEEKTRLNYIRNYNKVKYIKLD